MHTHRTVLLVCIILLLYTRLLHAQWVQTNGPLGGNVISFAVLGTNLFAGTAGNGIFLSTNSGTSWTVVNTGLTNTDVRALTVSGTNLFAGTAGGVFLSTNSGTNWTAINNGLTSTNVYALALSPNGAGGMNLFAGTVGGVFLSTNNGTNWTAVNSGLTNIFVYALAVSGANLFAGTTWGGGVFLSTNNGTSWTAVNTGLRTNTRVRAFAVSPNGTGGTNLFAGFDSSGVFLSTNSGTSWTAASTGLTNGSVYAFAVSGTNLFAGTLGGVFLSTTNGTSWTAVNTGLTFTDARALAVLGTNLFAGNNAGVFRRSLTDWMSLVYPAYGLGGITVPTTFTWKANPNALAYAFQISTDVNFSNLVVNQNTIDTTYSVSNLQLATAYYWRVRAENSSWASEWALGQFTTKLTGAPHLVSPASGATLVAISPTLSWDPIVPTAIYTLQLSTGPTFGTILYSKDTSSTSVILPQLQRSTTYYWRVRAQTVGDTTAWSSVSSFTTIPSPPKVISLVYPDSSKQDAYQNDWLVWRSDSVAISYLIQISQSPLFTTIYDSATVNSVGFRNSKKTFSSGSTYFWRVKGSNVGGDGPFSVVWSFKIGSGVRVPVTSYSFSNLDLGRVKVGQFKDTLLTITNSGTDSLKIQSIFSSSSVFSVRPTSRTLAPGQSFVDTIRFAPASGGNVNGSIVLVSNGLNSPDSIKVSGFGLSYELKLSTVKIDVGLVLLGKYKDTTFVITNTGSDTLKLTGISSSTQGITTRPTSFTILPNSFATDTIRFAPTIIGAVSGSIIILSNAPTSPDSVKLTASGVTTTTGIVQDRIPVSFGLEQNYPNPFNPSTTIKFSLPKTSYVTLRVLNILGEEVSTLVSQELLAGTHRTVWDAISMPSGVYFYRLQAGEFTETKKLILLR